MFEPGQAAWLKRMGRLGQMGQMGRFAPEWGMRPAP